MNFTKVKTVICLFLLAVNIFLGIMCIRLETKKKYISEEETELAEKHLADLGIHVEFDKNIGKKYSLPIYSVEEEFEETEIPGLYKEITEAFFSMKIDESEFLNTPTGYGVSAKNKSGILIGSSTLEGTDHFECMYEDLVNSADLRYISKPYYMHDNLGQNEDAERVAEAFLKKALMNYNIRFNNVGTAEYNGGTVVFTVAELSETEASDMYINVYVKGGKIKCCTGNIHNNVPMKKYSTDLLDAVDVLFLLPDFLDSDNDTSKSNGISIKSMKMEYRNFEYKANHFYIVPSWKIEYIDNSGGSNSISIDAIVGNNEFDTD